MARWVCLAFSLLWYSSKRLKSLLAISPAASSLVSWVIETIFTPTFLSIRSYCRNSNRSRKKRERLWTRDRLNRSRRLCRIGDHLLEYRAPVIGGRGPRLDILGGNGEVTRLAVRA